MDEARTAVDADGTDRFCFDGVGEFGFGPTFDGLFVETSV